MTTETDMSIATPMVMPSKKRLSHILIAGLGNLLLQDDGVGVHAINALKKDVPQGTCVVEVGTAVLDALHLFEWADIIIAVDAMRAGGAPGTVYQFGLEDVQKRSGDASLHELNLVAAFRFLKEEHRPLITIIGVEPEIIDYGMELSPIVAQALPTVTHRIQELVAGYRAAESSPEPE